MKTLRTRLAARRDFRAFERAVRRSRQYGGTADLHAAYRRS